MNLQQISRTPMLAPLLAGALFVGLMSVTPASVAAAQNVLPVATAQVARTKVMAHCSWPAQVRPGRIIMACGDGNMLYRHLRWRSWGRFRAVAVGQEWSNDCDPYCAAGHFHAYPVRIRLSRVWATEGHRVFHRVHFRYTGSRKPQRRNWHGHMQLPPYH